MSSLATNGFQRIWYLWMTVVDTFGFRWATAKRLKSIAGTDMEEVDPTGRKSRVEALLFLTPGGGIAARTGTGPWTPGVASCSRCEYYLDSGTLKIRVVSPTESIEVVNTVGVAIGASRLIQAKLINGRWTMDVDDCIA